MKDICIKIICGFRKDQQYTVSAEEAHKAYYLFLHPEERGIFGTGLALTGSQIKSIEPDYNATMGWNPEHELDHDDWNAIRDSGADRKIRDVLYIAKNIAIMEPAEKMGLPLSEIRPLLK